MACYLKGSRSAKITPAAPGRRRRSPLPHPPHDVPAHRFRPPQPGGRPHAEPEALRRAGEAARGATLYVTLEPCSHVGKSPPCADAVIAAGIARVVSAMEDPNPEVAGQGHARLRAAGIAVDIGLGAAEAAHDHAGHIRRTRDKRPHVIPQLAVSADGHYRITSQDWRHVAYVVQTEAGYVFWSPGEQGWSWEHGSLSASADVFLADATASAALIRSSSRLRSCPAAAHAYEGSAAANAGAATAGQTTTLTYTYTVGGIELRAMYTPGHTPGGTSFVGHGMVFDGDTLFPGGPGNTQRPDGDFSQIIENISRKLFTLPDHTKVFPGHGKPTTIGDERPHLGLGVGPGSNFERTHPRCELVHQPVAGAAHLGLAPGKLTSPYLRLMLPVALSLKLGLGFWPTFIALVPLGIPPVLTNSYVAVREVDRDVVEAARGMGLREVQVLRQVELPIAAPLIIAGMRNSAVAIVATATLGALVAAGAASYAVLVYVLHAVDRAELAGLIRREAT